MIQSGNWRGARDPARPKYNIKNFCTGLVPAKSTGTQPEPVPAQIPPERVPERTGTRILVGS